MTAFLSTIAVVFSDYIVAVLVAEIGGYIDKLMTNSVALKLIVVYKADANSVQRATTATTVVYFTYCIVAENGSYRTATMSPKTSIIFSDHSRRFGE